MTDDVVDDATDGLRRNRQLQVSRRPRGVEADDGAARVDERAARESRIERQVEREEVGPGDASRPGVDGADDPPAGPRPGAHGQHHVSHANRVGVAGVGHGEAGRVDPEDGDVQRGVPTDDRGRRRGAVRPRHGHVVLGLHGMVRGDDQAGMPVDARRRHARPAVHGHDGPTRSLDRRRQLVRERKQLVHVPLPALHVSSMCPQDEGARRPREPPGWAGPGGTHLSSVIRRSDSGRIVPLWLDSAQPQRFGRGRPAATKPNGVRDIHRRPMSGVVFA